MTTLSISIVTHLPNPSALKSTLKCLSTAVKALVNVSQSTWIIDNSPPSYQGEWLKIVAEEYFAQLICGHGNIGFGRGHNIILDRIGDFHLILNPDVELDENSLVLALNFMKSNPECGLLVPHSRWPDGTQQYLCKRLPTVFDLFLRGFTPPFVQSWFQRRLHHYEMRDVIGNSIYWDPPMVSGCCMLYRGEILKKLSGFDPGYFLYYEDSDISLRTAKISRIVYFPEMKIIHHGGHAARKGWRHISMFIKSAARFFNTHGWRWL